MKGLGHLCTSSPLPESSFHRRGNNRDGREANPPRTAQPLLPGLLLLRQTPSKPPAGSAGAAGSSARTRPKPRLPKPRQRQRCPSPSPAESHRQQSLSTRHWGFPSTQQSGDSPRLHQQHHVVLLLQPSLRNTSSIKSYKDILIKKYVYLWAHRVSLRGLLGVCL